MENNQITISRKENALRIFPNSGIFLIEMNPDKCREKYSKCITSIDCARSKSANLIELNDWYGLDCPKDWVSLQLATLNLFVNVSQHLTPEQIKETSYWIYDRFSMLNLADITLVISRIKLGEYGKLYNNLSGEFILDCFSYYAKERRNKLNSEEIEKSRAYPNIQSFGAAIVHNIDKLPSIAALLDKVKNK